MLIILVGNHFVYCHLKVVSSSFGTDLLDFLYGVFLGFLPLVYSAYMQAGGKL